MLKLLCLFSGKNIYRTRVHRMHPIPILLNNNSNAITTVQ